MAEAPKWMYALLGALSLGYLVSRTVGSSRPKPVDPPAPVATFALVDAAVPSAPAVPIELRGPRMWFSAAVYLPARPTKPFAELLKARSFTVAKELTNTGSLVRMREVEVAKFPPPTIESLERFGVGMSEAEKAALQKSVAVVGFEFEAPVSNDALQDAMRVLSDFASATNGVVYDVDTRQAFSRAAWDERTRRFVGGVPMVSAHIVIHAYREGDLVRAVTLGMNKFALPDVAVDQVMSNDALKMSELIQIVCQVLVEKGRLDAPGRLDVALDELKSQPARLHYEKLLFARAAKKASVELVAANKHEGDAENSLVNIAFPGSVVALQQRQSAFLRAFFGDPESAMKVKSDDPELLAASAHARSTLLAKHKARWTKKQQSPLETLSVKAPFPDAKGTPEYMWVEVVSWEGTTISGILQNDSIDNPAWKSGKHVLVEESTVYDYILNKGDGSEEGNETGALIKAKQK